MLADQMTVATALDVLCAPRRDTLHLSSYDGLSQPEIVVRLDLRIGTVRSHGAEDVPDVEPTWRLLCRPLTATTRTSSSSVRRSVSRWTTTSAR